MNAINRPAIRTHLTTKFIAFSIVGVIGTLAHYSILHTLVEFHSINPVIASGYGAVAGLLINYEVIAKLQMWTGFSPEKGVEKGGHFWHDGVSQAHINALL